MRRFVGPYQGLIAHTLLSPRWLTGDLVTTDLVNGDSASPTATGNGAASPSPLSDSYNHQLFYAGTTFKLHGEPAYFASEESNRVFSSGRLHSYDPSILFAEMRQQELLQGSASLYPEGDFFGKGNDERTAVMYEGRDKQGAAGAAAVAAAMLESRRPPDVVPLMPNHPLPVVFPRLNVPVAPLRYAKMSPGQARLLGAAKRAQPAVAAFDDTETSPLCSDGVSVDRLEGHAVQYSTVYQARVVDEGQRARSMRTFPSFSAISTVIPETVLRGLARSGFNKPTLLQSAAIPLLLKGKNMLCIAPNGCGKSLACAVSSVVALGKLQKRKASFEAPPSPLLVVLCPNRETVLCTTALYATVAEEDTEIASAFSNSRGEPSPTAMSSNCSIIVATPERLSDLVSARQVSLDAVRVVAVDRLDWMVGQQVRSSLRMIIDGIERNPQQHQTSLWAGAFTNEVAELSHQYFSSSYTTVRVRKVEQTDINVTQILYPFTAASQRLAYIKQLYKQRTILKRHQVLIYCAEVETAENLAKELVRMLSAPAGMVQCVHAELSRGRQEKVIRDFRQGTVRILIDTDVSPRLMDFPNLRHIIHYDIPGSTEVYARRTRRASRATRPGTVHVFLSPNDVHVPGIVHYVAAQTGHVLNEEIQSMVRRIEQARCEEDWDVSSSGS